VSASEPRSVWCRPPDHSETEQRLKEIFGEGNVKYKPSYRVFEILEAAF